MFWEYLNTIPSGWYVVFFLIVIVTALVVKGQAKLVPNNRWRFGDDNIK